MPLVTAGPICPALVDGTAALTNSRRDLRARAGGPRPPRNLVPAAARLAGGFLSVFRRRLELRGRPRRQPDRGLADLPAALTGLSPFPRAGGRGGIKSRPGGGAPRRRISVSVFRQRRLELRGRPRRQLDRALADLGRVAAGLSPFPRRAGGRGGMGKSGPGGGAPRRRISVSVFSAAPA